MDSKAVSSLLSATGSPAFAIQDGRLALCTPEAQALGFRDGELPEALLPVHALPPRKHSDEAFPILLGGERWLLQSAFVEGWTLCFLRRELPFIPAPNEQTMLHAAGRMRLSIQDVETAVEQMDGQGLQKEDREASIALALRAVYQLTHTAKSMELFSLLRGGKYRLRNRSINLAAWMEDFCREAGGLLQELGLNLRWELPMDYKTDVVDWELLSALLWELLANAAANSKDGSIRLEMRRLGDRKVLFTLVNLPETPLEARFHQHAEPQQALTEDLGLGLSLASLGAAVLGGSFLLSSRPDGRVEAALSVAVHRPQEDVVQSAIQTPVTEMHPGLLALSKLLPRDSFHPDRLL